jgi:hypothetical protein
MPQKIYMMREKRMAGKNTEGREEKAERSLLKECYQRVLIRTVVNGSM